MDIKTSLINKTKKWISEKGILEIDLDSDIECWDKENKEIRGGATKDVYVVSFRTKDYVEYDEQGAISMFTEGMYCWAYYDAANLKLLYILKPHGYIEPDGTY